MNIEKHITQRGFAKLEFEDRYGSKCSLQESSLAEEGAVWFGVDKLKAEIMAKDALDLGIETNGQTIGWVQYPIPEQVVLNNRMHLTQEMVQELLPALQYFAEHGVLPD